MKICICGLPCRID
jgi:serine/threonine protein kinase